jgi:hypothetical protein
MLRICAVLLTAFAVLTVSGMSGGRAADEEKTITVNFRDIQRDGKVAVIGHFGIPVGQKVTIEGRRAKPSKVSNQMTLSVEKVNGVATKRGESPLIQITNVDSLPDSEAIVLEGYEFLGWRGAPAINWHVDSSFMITRVVAPKGLESNARQPY